MIAKINADVREGHQRSGVPQEIPRAAGGAAAARARWRRSPNICSKDSAKWAKVIKAANLKID